MQDSEYIDYLKRRREELSVNLIPSWKFWISIVGFLVGIGALIRLIDENLLTGTIAVVGIGLGIWGGYGELLGKQELRRIEDQLRDLE